MNKYQVNKRILVKLMGSAQLTWKFTRRERIKICRRGKLPKDMNCHHIVPRSCGGGDDIENLAIMLKEDHMKLHRTISKAIGQFRITKNDRPVLTQLALEAGAFIYNR